MTNNNMSNKTIPQYCALADYSALTSRELGLTQGLYFFFHTKFVISQSFKSTFHPRISTFNLFNYLCTIQARWWSWWRSGAQAGGTSGGHSTLGLRDGEWFFKNYLKYWGLYNCTYSKSYNFGASGDPSSPRLYWNKLGIPTMLKKLHYCYSEASPLHHVYSAPLIPLMLVVYNVCWLRQEL